MAVAGECDSPRHANRLLFNRSACWRRVVSELGDEDDTAVIVVAAVSIGV